MNLIELWLIGRVDRFGRDEGGSDPPPERSGHSKSEVPRLAIQEIAYTASFESYPDIGASRINGSFVRTAAVSPRRCESTLRVISRPSEAPQTRSRMRLRMDLRP